MPFRKGGYNGNIHAAIGVWAGNRQPVLVSTLRGTAVYWTRCRPPRNIGSRGREVALS